MNKLEIEVINTGSSLPVYETDGAAGFDFKSQVAMIINPGETRVIPTGLFVKIPKGYELQVRSRSGLALKNKLIVLNSPGTIDSDYRGEISIILTNFGTTPYKVLKNDRIAQGVISKVFQAVWNVVTTLDTTIRGQNGFGSTGT